MKININRISDHINKISQFNTTPGDGCSRFSFTEEDKGVREYLCGKMKDLGMSVSVDSIGNIRGRINGADPALPVVTCGSHIDTVVNGGNFDGVLGVVCALEAIQTIIENGLKFNTPYEIIIFAEEEGITFNYNLVGSKAICGLCKLEDIKKLEDKQGTSMYERLKSFGINPDNLQNDIINPEEIKALIELHIEQGSCLDRMNIPVGIVTAIVDLQWYEIEIQGVSNHAGATAMKYRTDPMIPSAQLIADLPGIIIDHGDNTNVVTTGRLICRPNMPNIIAESVRFTVDLRGTDSNVLRNILNIIKDRLKEYEKNGFTCTIKQLTNAEGVNLSENIINTLKESAEEENIEYVEMVSGSNHDCGIMAKHIPAAMIFVPSVNGRSHCKEEYTNSEDIEKGCQVLFKTLIKILQ